MRILVRRLLLGLLATGALLVVVMPIALYWVGIYAVDSLPSPPSELASAEQRSTAWQQVRGRGEPKIHALTPYSYLFDIAANAEQDPGKLAAWQVASDHLLTHRRNPGMVWWHLSGAALTIWISRNWTTEQILSNAAKSEGKHAG